MIRRHRERWLAVSFVRVLPPLVPPLILLSAIAAHAVNVPRWDDWGLIPFVVALRDGSLGFADFWAQHNEHRIAAVKLILAPLVLATDFDVKAMMYAGFALQLLALAFLWSRARYHGTRERPAARHRPLLRDRPADVLAGAG